MSEAAEASCRSSARGIQQLVMTTMCVCRTDASGGTHKHSLCLGHSFDRKPTAEDLIAVDVVARVIHAEHSKPGRPQPRSGVIPEHWPGIAVGVDNPEPLRERTSREQLPEDILDLGEQARSGDVVWDTFYVFESEDE
jgi:hypothetical protein